MDSALLVHRLHFAFTVTFHYLFPQLTMGLALILVILKTLALRTGNPHYDQCARFWARKVRFRSLAEMPICQPAIRSARSRANKIARE